MLLKMSDKIKNDIISIIGSVILNIVLKRVKETKCFSILSHGTMDISGRKVE